MPKDPFGRPIEDAGVGMLADGSLDVMSEKEMRKRLAEREADEEDDLADEYAERLGEDSALDDDKTEGKFFKTAVNYTPKATDPAEQCRKCKHFRPKNGCAKVYGVIVAEGWCEEFEGK